MDFVQAGDPTLAAHLEAANTNPSGPAACGVSWCDKEGRFVPARCAETYTGASGGRCVDVLMMGSKYDTGQVEQLVEHFKLWATMGFYGDEEFSETDKTVYVCSDCLYSPKRVFS